jgi:hypothetical protein
MKKKKYKEVRAFQRLVDPNSAKQKITQNQSGWWIMIAIAF